MYNNEEREGKGSLRGLNCPVKSWEED